MSLPQKDQNTPTWPFPPETTLNPPGVHRITTADGQELVPLRDLSLHQRRGIDPDVFLGRWRDVDPAPAWEPGSSSGRLHRFRSFPAGEEAPPPPEKCSAVEDPDAKKNDHNAKERARRMKLNSSYLNLGALLPDFQTSKKKWTGPGIVNRALEYIPGLQNEIENLTIRKENMLSETGNTQNSERDQQNQTPTITVHEIRRGEMVLQICAQRRGHDDAQLASLMRKIEAESLNIVNVSTASAPDDRFYSYQIHIQVNETSHHRNVEAFRDKVISWFGT